MDLDWVLVIRLVTAAFVAFLVGVSLVVSYNYSIAYSKSDKRSWQGLLPLHVITISLSYSLLLIYTAVTAVLRTEEGGPLSWWRLALVVPAIILGVVAMITMTQYRRRDGLKEDSKFS